MSVPMDTLSFSNVFSAVPVMWTEVYLFAFAAFLYVVLTGNILPERFRRQAAKTIDQPKQDATPKPESLRAISSALHRGNIDEALDGLADVSADAFALMPLQTASRLLLALAESKRGPELISNLSWGSWKPDARALEVALSEAARRNDVVVGWRLGQMADDLSVVKTSRSFELLAGAAPNARSLRALVDEVRNSDIPMSKRLVLAVLGACAVTTESELASELVASAELPQSDPDLCAALIRVYASCEQWDMACCIYEEVMMPANLRPDPPLSEMLMRAAGYAGRSDLMPKLCEFLAGGEMARQARAIRAFGKDGDLDGAVTTFDKLKEGNVPISPVVYNCLIEACVQCGEMQAALKYLDEAKANGAADVVGYNTAMKGQLALGDDATAERLLAEMAQRGLSASLVTYHSLLNARARACDCHSAWRLVAQMRGAGLQPTAVTYSIFLKGCAAPSDAVHVTRVVDLIDETGVVMDEVLFASVVEACIRTGSLDLLAERTRQSPQGLTAPTYGSMIKAYGQARDVTQVWSLWKEMISREVRPTSITFGCMVEALVINGSTEEAWRLVQELWEEEQHRSLVNTVIYSTILKGFVLSKQPDRLMALYDEMRSRGIACNNIAYNTMLNAFAHCGAMHRVPQLLEDMKCANPPAEPDIVTYSTIVKGYCASGNLDKGLQLLQEMRKGERLSPDEVMYNSLLDGCAREHRLDEALRLLDDMRESGVAPSNYTLSILVKLLGRSRRLPQAFTMVETLCSEHGFRANIQVYTCLMQACFHNRQPGKALALHDQIVREGCKPDQKTYVALARGCLQAGIVDKAAEVVRCAHHLSGHNLMTTRGNPAGVDNKCLEDVLSRLGVDTDAARHLSADVKSSSLHRAREEGPSRPRPVGSARAGARGW